MADSPDYVGRDNAATAIYLTGQAFGWVPPDPRVDPADVAAVQAQAAKQIAELEAEMDPERLKRLRHNGDRLERVARVLGLEVAIGLLSEVLKAHQDGVPGSVSDLLEAALEVIENA